MTLKDSRLALFSHLVDAIMGNGAMSSVDHFLLSLPGELELATVRTCLPELLTTPLLLEQDLPPRIVDIVLQSLIVSPGPLIRDRRSAMSDYAAALLLEKLGIVDVMSHVSVEAAWPPPQDWTALGEWAADTACLAVPALTTVNSVCRRRGSDLARFACLAELEGRTLTAARLLRWVPFVELDSRTSEILVEMGSYLSHIYRSRGDIQFHVAITRLSACPRPG